MEHSQKEFIIEQLRSIDRMFESPKSTELLHIENGISTFSMSRTRDLLRQESTISPTNTEVIVKSYPSRLYGQSLREYLIGLTVINPLRNITPCFVQTLGGFNHTPTETCIIYEKIRGNTLATMLQEGLSFDSWLRLFVQILLSLELAQRNTGFTHYDLHADNIVVGTQDPKDYSIFLDDLTYNVTNPNMVPVIIDLGTSSTLINGRFIGAYDYVNSGIFHFIVAGHDMYKLMVSSYCHSARSDTRKRILQLFKFFGTADPYQICQGQGRAGIAKAQQEFCKEILFSDIASYTPLMLVKYIHKNLFSTLVPILDIVPRKIHSSLTSLNGTEDYNRVLVTSQRLVDERTGYITAAYILHVAEYSTCQDTIKNIKRIRKQLNQDRNQRIANDLIMLSDVFNIQHPSQSELDEARVALLGTPIRYRNASVKEQRFDCLDELLEYQDDFRPFLDMYFTILEMDLEDYYRDWIEKLYTSNIYTFYFSNKIDNDRARRWGETLLATIISRN